MSSRGVRPCPGCGRKRNSCWLMPCLYLETVLAKGAPAVQRYVRGGVPSDQKKHVFVERRA